MLKIYNCRPLPEENENKQLEKLIEQMHKYFNNRDHDIHLLINPKLPGISRQFDLIMFRRSKFAVIELKNITGIFYPNVDEQKLWEHLDDKGNRVEFESENTNPFTQVSNQKWDLATFLQNKFQSLFNGKISREAHKAARKLISTFIVTAPDSEAHDYNDSMVPWCTLRPISEELMRRLTWVGTGEGFGFPDSEFNTLLTLVNAVETTISDWPYNGIIPQYETSKIPEVDRFLKNDSEESILKGLNYCNDLKLIRYFDDIAVLSSSSSRKVRFLANTILFRWLNDFQRKFGFRDAEQILKNSITDEYTEVRKLALDFVIGGSYSYKNELQQIFVDMLSSENNFHLMSLFVRSLEYFRNRQFSEYKLKIFYEEKISKGFFGWFKERRNIARRLGLNREYFLPISKTDEDSELHSEYRKSNEQIEGWDGVIKAWIDTISVVGSTLAGILVLNHLKVLLSHYKEYSLAHWSLPPTFEESLEALETLQPEGASDFLTEALRDSDNDSLTYHLIDSLGKLKVKEATDLIKPYLYFCDQNSDVAERAMRWQAASALSRIGKREFFDDIWYMFVHEKEPRTPYSGGEPLFDALIRLDKIEVEERLLMLLQKDNYSESSFSKFGNLLKQAGGKKTFETLSKMLVERGMFLEDWAYGPSEIVAFLVWSQEDLKHKGMTTGLEFLNLNREDLVPLGLDLSQQYFVEHPEELVRYEKSTSYHTLSRVIHIYDSIKLYNKVEKFVTNKNKDAGDLAFIILREAEGYKYFDNFFVAQGSSLKWGKFIVGKDALIVEFSKLNRGTIDEVQGLNRIKKEEIRNMKLIKKGKTPIGLVISTTLRKDNFLFLYSGKLMRVDILLSNDSIVDTDASELKNQLMSVMKMTQDDSDFVISTEHILQTLRQALVKEALDGDSYFRKERNEKNIAKFDQEFKKNELSLQ